MCPRRRERLFDLAGAQRVDDASMVLSIKRPPFR
jgi:hypothetical protein